ncbi:MAG: helix-turn-helix domain-containing protein [Candidatus Eremiobacteraeota bacterium]|nr:helix-turn-helix domain-containing protein [Candidatus Eremiobacteraeota bacterium]
MNIASASARIDGKAIDLPPREVALLVTLGLAPRVWPSYKLIPLLWPEVSAANSSSLKVYVHRLRSRLGPSAIASTNKGYELAGNICVDLWEARLLMERASLTEAERAALCAFHARACSADRSYLSRFAWFAGAEKFIAREISEVALRLAKDALHRNAHEECMHYVSHALSNNPSEHRFREVAILAHMQRRDQRSAQREYEAFLADHQHQVVEAPVVTRLQSLAAPRINTTRRPFVSRQKTARP